MLHFLTMPQMQPNWRGLRAVLFLCISLVVLVAWFVLSGMLAIAMNWITVDALQNALASADLLVMAFVQMAVVLPLALLLGRYVLKLPFGHHFSVEGRVRWHLFIVALICSTLGMLLFYVGETLLSGSTLSVKLTDISPIALVAVLLVLPFQCAAEEVIFRGLLLQVCVSWWGNTAWKVGLAVVLSSVCFALIHGEQNPALWLNRFFMGLIFCYMVIKTKGIEACIALHIANNFAFVVLGALTGTLVDDLFVTESSWSIAIGQIVCTGILAYVIVTLLEKKNVISAA